MSILISRASTRARDARHVKVEYWLLTKDSDSLSLLLVILFQSINADCLTVLIAFNTILDRLTNKVNSAIMRRGRISATIIGRVTTTIKGSVFTTQIRWFLGLGLSYIATCGRFLVQREVVDTVVPLGCVAPFEVDIYGALLVLATLMTGIKVEILLSDPCVDPWSEGVK